MLASIRTFFDQPHPVLELGNIQFEMSISVCWVQVMIPSWKVHAALLMIAMVISHIPLLPSTVFLAYLCYFFFTKFCSKAERSKPICIAGIYIGFEDVDKSKKKR